MTMSNADLQHMKNKEQSLINQFRAAIMTRRLLRAILPMAVAGLFSVSAAQASLTATGDVSPANPSTWTSSTGAIVGNTGVGSLTVDGASILKTTSMQMGYGASSTGTLTITGNGSSYTGTGGFKVGVGTNAAGYFNVTNGGVATIAKMLVGNSAGSKGIVTIDGTGSAVNITSAGLNLYIGGAAAGASSGTAYITNGGKLNNTGTAGQTVIANCSGSYGSVFVDGAGSAWANTGSLAVGGSGTATLSVSNGGSVTAAGITINSTSKMTIDAGSTLSLSSGTISNSGKVTLVAGASAANGTYTPMSYSSISGSGTLQAVGGVWNATSHTFTVSAAATANAGTTTTIDRSTTQRLLVTDATTDKSIGIAFQSAAATSNVSITASAISGSELASLQSSIGTGKSVLSGWDLSVTSGNPGTSYYLSLSALGADTSLASLVIWKYDGSSWSQYAASDLAYNKSYASFSISDLDGYAYAVSGTATPTPIPAAAWLLGSGLLGLVGLKKKSRTV